MINLKRETKKNRITGITGNILTGKSTLAKYLTTLGYKLVLEYTTRPMREGEKDGIDYHFIKEDTFDVMEAAGNFAEILHVETKFGLWKYGSKKRGFKRQSYPCMWTDTIITTFRFWYILFILFIRFIGYG